MDEKAMEATITSLETKIGRLVEKIQATSVTSSMDGEILEIEPSLAVPGSSSLHGSILNIGKVAQQSSDGLGATVSVKVRPEGSRSRSFWDQRLWAFWSSVIDSKTYITGWTENQKNERELGKLPSGKQKNIPQP